LVGENDKQEGVVPLYRLQVPPLLSLPLAAQSEFHLE